MKQRDLILGLGILSAFTLSAASPYKGSVPPTEGSGDFFIYQVETGRWIQDNHIIGGTETYIAVGDKTGIDFNIFTVEGGWQLDPKHGNNKSLNGDNWEMGSDRKATIWGFEPVDVDGVENAYRIMMIEKAGCDPYELGLNENGSLGKNTERNTWQLVSREDRIAHMVETATAGEPADATWLIPGQHFDSRDERADLWTLSHADDGSGIGHNGVQRNKVREAWNNARSYYHKITLTDIPNGTYRFRVQGYFRENWDDQNSWMRYNAGMAPQRANYFAGAAQHPLMNIADEHLKEKTTDQQTEQIARLDGEFIPNSMQAASDLFVKYGKFYNPWIETVVTDGTLTVGVDKLEGTDRDWLIYDNFELEYLGESTDFDYTEAVEDLNQLMLTTEALPANYEPLNEAKAQAVEAQKGNDGEAMRAAHFAIFDAVKGYVIANAQIFRDLATLAEEEGIDTASYIEAFENAAPGGLGGPTTDLRYARRRAAADKQEDVFEGQVPAAGDFYLYNVGQKQFLSGGSDWGAHAALGFPGIEVTLEPDNVEELTFWINSHLNNGGENEYMNYRGYMDCAKPDGSWKFVKVEGKTGVYNIVQNDYPDVHVAWNPNATVNDGQGDETTVGTECRDLNADDLNAQWKLVTKAERLALMKDASVDNPVDVTFLIKSPGFNQREKANEVWAFDCEGGNNVIQDYGSNRNDFSIESWNSSRADISQALEGLPEGHYMVQVQGYYRNGGHYVQPEKELKSYMFLYADESEVDENGDVQTYAGEEDDVEIVNPEYMEIELPNITAGANMAPGEGKVAVYPDGSEFTTPDDVYTASKYFKLGLYKTALEIHKASDNSKLTIGVKKYGDSREVENDWSVFDNFRLSFLGNTKTGVEGVAAEAAAAVSGSIYNLQGVEVNNPTAPGIYIRDGKKFVVK
ncbi:MAG: hypothetical protein HDS68_02795 [Bacteroidales bacterium]|nr:hypothetical protein [Bacteroidales bacterium]